MIDVHAQDLAYYAEAGRFTRLDGVDPRMLPDSIAELVGVVQGLLVHRAWIKAYQVDLPAERNPEEGLHATDAMLGRVMALRNAPITTARAPADRMLSNCRHFSTLMTAFLRRKRVPARARCGFATYFQPGKYVDHWVCEYWDRDEDRWRMVDAQLDALQRAIVKPDFDTLDVPERAFWVAGKAWQRCRAGEVNPDLFGIADMWGLWYVGGNLFLDIASLSKIELLPWDAAIIARQLEGIDTNALLDGAAPLSAGAASGPAAEARAFYETTPNLAPSEEALRGIEEADARGTTAANPLAG